VRPLAGALLAGLLLASGCDSSPSSQTSPSPPPTTATPSPVATTGPALDPLALRLRRLAAAREAACPCSVFVRVTDKAPRRELELFGTWRPRERKAVLTTFDRATSVVFLADRTYFRGPASGDRWVRLDTSRLPDRVRRSTDLSMAAVAHPGTGFRLARSITYAYDSGTREGGKTGLYGGTFDLAVVRPDAFLRRLLGEPTPYGTVLLDSKRFDGVSYGVLGPSDTIETGISVYVAVYPTRRYEPDFDPPADAPVLTVR